MSIKNTEVDQLNFLQVSGYSFEIERLPYTTFMTQAVYFPTIVLPDITTGNPFQKLNYASTEIDFGKLAVDFKIDEKMKNFTEIFNWMKGLGFPEDQTQYAEVKYRSRPLTGLFSDASVLILSSSKIPVKEFVFRDIFPVSLGNLRFESTLEDVQYAVATVVFSMRDFIIKDIDEN